MFHLFHNWRPIKTTKSLETDWSHSIGGWYKYKATSVYYTCATSGCYKTKIEEIEGHWELNEIGRDQ